MIQFARHLWRRGILFATVAQETWEASMVWVAMLEFREVCCLGVRDGGEEQNAEEGG
jgi:hypothetical protein